MVGKGYMSVPSGSVMRALGAADAVPGPAVDGIEHLDRHGMGRRGKDFRRDERHPLDPDEAFGKDRATIAHQDLVEFLLLLLLFPHIHPFGEFPGAEQVIVHLIHPDPLRDRSAVDMAYGVFHPVFLKDPLAGLDGQRRMPVVHPQHDPLAAPEVPAGIQAMIVGAARHMFEIGQQLIRRGDLHEGRTARPRV
jgi:hypothetical protein